MHLRTRPVVFGLLAILSLALLAVAMPQAWYPMWFDQGAFAACGDALRRGGVFLRDCWDVRGPLTPMLYALATTLGQAQMAVFVFNLAWQAAASVLLGMLAGRMFGRMAGLAAATLYWLMMATLNYWSVAQAEGFANLLFIAATLIVWEGAQRPSRPPLGPMLAGGMIAGALLWFKYPFALYAVVLAIWLILARMNFAAIAGFSAGVALSAVLGIGYFAIHGALADWLTHANYAIANFHHKPLAERWQWLTGLFWIEISTFAQIGSTPTAGFKDTVPQVQLLGRGYPFVLLLAALGAARSLWGARAGGGLAVLWLLTTVALNVWQGHSYRYHFIIWLPPLAVLAGAAFADPRAPTRATRLLARVLPWPPFIAAVIGLVATMWPWMRDAYDNAVAQRKSPATLQLESKEAAQWLLAEFLRDHTAADETIAVFSDTPVVYFYAQRPNATRFPYLRWADEARDPTLRAKLEQDYVADLTRTPPRFFVLSRDDFPWAGARFIETWKRMTQVNRFVEDNYEYVGENGPYLLFRRRDFAGAIDSATTACRAAGSPPPDASPDGGAGERYTRAYARDLRAARRSAPRACATSRETDRHAHRAASGTGARRG